MRLDLEFAHLLRRDLVPDRVPTSIDRGAQNEAAAVRCGADQVHHGLERANRLAAPVHRDEREHAVLDLVPLAGPWREMADVDGQAELVGEALQLKLSHAGAMAGAAPRVGRDVELRRIRVALASHPLPPRLDRGHREHRRVVIGADVDEAAVVRDVVDAVRDRLAKRVAWEIVNVDEFRSALRLPLDACVLEIPDQLLGLRIDGDERYAARDTVPAGGTRPGPGGAARGSRGRGVRRSRRGRRTRERADGGLGCGARSRPSCPRATPRWSRCTRRLRLRGTGCCSRLCRAARRRGRLWRPRHPRARHPA